jgi:hypothetical protein
MPEKLWFEAHVSFEADSFDAAETVVDAMVLAVCEGFGEGNDHICRRQFVVSGPKAIPEEPEEDIT